MMKREEPVAESDYEEGVTQKMMTAIRKIASPADRGGYSGGGVVSLPFDLNARPVFIALALMALAVGMLFLVPNVFAQDASTIEYPENGTDSVVTFTAEDPEGDTITWSLSTDDGGGEDNDSFAIDEDDGILTFNSPPDYEADAAGGGDRDRDNTYEVQVTATDTADPENTDTFDLNVKVTDIAEPGKVTWTVDPDGTTGPLVAADVNGGTPIMQFQAGATLTASLTDDDVAGIAKAVTDARWQWYRSSSKTSQGTPISGQISNSYTVQDEANDNDVGMYLRVEASYNVVTGTADSASRVSDYPVQAYRANNSAPEFDPTEVTLKVSEGDKGMTVGTVRATDDDRDVLNYVLAGADSTEFEIDQTGQITTSVDLDYEAEAAADDNCTDMNACEVEVTATDSAGAASAVATVTINIENVDEKPTFSTGYETVSIVENTTDVDVDGDNDPNDGANLYAAADPEGDVVNWSLNGVDRALFNLNASDVSAYLSFKTEPDFEDPTDRDRDNKYEVTVRASDGTLNADRMVIVTVTDVNEAPEIMETSDIEYAENVTDSVVTFTAEDPEGDTITWSLSTDDGGGEDNDSFAIDEDDGILTFNSPPDYEADAAGGGDRDRDNTYEVQVTATDTADPENTDTFDLNVKVTDIAEPGKVTWTVDPDGTTGPLVAANVNGGEPIMQFQTGATLTASVTDGDVAGVTKNPDTVDWKWYRGGTLISDQNANIYNVVSADVGRRLRVEASYNVVIGVPDSASRTSDHPVQASRQNNSAPEFDPTEVTLKVSEGDKGMTVGTVRATDDDRDVRNYALAGDDSTEFEIDQKTGQITTSVDLDYEAEAAADDNCTDLNACEVEVTATDSAGAASAVATVTINIENVDEKPTFSTGEETASVAETETEVSATAYAAADPEGGVVSRSLIGADASLFRLDSAGVLSFKTKPDFEDPTDRDRDNKYEVTVRASDGTLTADRMVIVTVTDVNEAPEIMFTRGEVTNTPPEFASAATTRTVAEDAAARENIGAPVEAMDAGDTLSYMLGGTDAASFTINSRTGQLMTSAALDFETKASYSVTVTATDSASASDSIDVTITVTDVDETADMTPLERYDTNDNDRIDKDELVEAIFDYNVNETLEKEDLVELILSYEIG